MHPKLQRPTMDAWAPFTRPPSTVCNFFNVMLNISSIFSVIVVWIEITVFPVDYVMRNPCCTLRIPRKNGVVKEAIVLQWVVRIASCDFKPGKKGWAGALLSEKCCGFAWKPSWKSHANYELARLKKKKKKRHFDPLATFWFGTFAVLFSTTGCVVCPRRWMVSCYNSL